MTVFFVASLAAEREVMPLRVLCLAAMAIALAQPGAPLDVSFQLSFVSVLSLVLAGEGWSRRWPVTRDEGWRRRLGRGVALAFAVPAAALLGTAPLVASWFNRLTPIGIVSNPLLVPLTATPATIIGLAGAAVSEISETLSRGTFALARWPLDGFRYGVELAAAVPFGSIRIVGLTLFELAIGYLLLGLPWIPKRARLCVALVACFAFAVDACAWCHERLWRDSLRVRFLDVGQGDAAVVEAAGGKVLVIDGGGFARGTFDVGERVVAPYLWSRKIARVDAIVASHGDWDHQGGLHFVASAFAPRQLWTVKLSAERKRLAALEKIATDAGAVVRPLAAGDIVSLGDDLQVECLNPPDVGEPSANDSSLVLRIRFGGTTLLFTGDVESSAETMIAGADATEPVTVMKVPHHGSGTSSGDRLLGWTAPRLAVISLAAGNHYGFPSSEVLRRYRRIGAGILRTDVDGSVWFESDGTAIDVRPFARSSRVFCSFFGALC
jgi:competence protein ComEC